MTSDRETLYELWSRHGSSYESDSSEGYELADAILAAGFVRARGHGSPHCDKGVVTAQGCCCTPPSEPHFDNAIPVNHYPHAQPIAPQAGGGLTNDQ